MCVYFDPCLGRTTFVIIIGPAGPFMLGIFGSAGLFMQIFLACVCVHFWFVFLCTSFIVDSKPWMVEVYHVCHIQYSYNH